MKKTLLLLTVLFMASQLSGCSQKNPQEKTGDQAREKEQEIQQEKPMNEPGNETLVLITTKFGDITLKLYNDTPNHRDNFMKMIREGWYDDSPFHRIIPGFMIQGGGNKDGRQDPGYTIDAEFVAHHFHKKGALAAARLGDQVNPKKASSGCQFYIVQGNVLDNASLDSFEQRSGMKFTDEQRKAYTTIGGSPWLDGGYTVFGEVVTGFEVIDKIAAVPRDASDKPLEPVTMKIEIIE